MSGVYVGTGHSLGATNYFLIQHRDDTILSLPE